MGLFGIVTVPATVRALFGELGGVKRGQILGAVAFGWFLALGIRLAVPALVPYIRSDFGIGLTTAGMLLSVLWVCYALFQLPGGILGDRIGERNILTGGVVLVILGLVVSILAPTIAILFVGIGLIGIATGLFATTRFTILTDIFPDRGATAIGISSAAGNVGTVTLPVAMGFLAAEFSWWAGFAAVTPIVGVAALSLWLIVPPRTSGNESAVDELSLAIARDLSSAISQRQIVVFITSMLLMSFIYQGFTSFYPTYLIDVKGLSKGSAATLYSVFFATGVVIQPIGGAIGDSFSDRTTLISFTGLTAVALVLLTAANGFWTLLVISMLISTQLGFWPIAQAAVAEALPSEIQGTGFGFLRTTYLLLAAVSPTVIGLLADRNLFDEAFFLLAGCAGVTVCFVFFLSIDRS